MKARLISVGERMPAWVADGVAEYRKRLSRDLPLELVEIELGNRGKGRDPARAIAETAEHMNCDLIVMSSHGYGSILSVLTGSTTAKVVSECAVPVLVVH